MSGGRRLYGALHLLDRQIVDVDGRLAGKVDDVELEPSADGTTFHVVSILSGAGALGPRLGGRLGRFVAAVHERLADEPVPARVSFGVVTEVGNHVTVALPRDQLESNRAEEWTRVHVIDHVPERTVRLSELIGVEVVDADGETVGTVHDVVLAQDGPIQGSWGAALRLESLLVGTGSIGTRLGVDRPGARRPWIVAAFFARRRRYEVAWGDVASHDTDRITLSTRRNELSAVEHPDHEPV